MHNLFLLLAQLNSKPSHLPAASTNGLLQTGFNIILGIAGALAIFWVAFGAFRLVTSNGNPDSVSKARSTILYAIVGLVVVMIAFSIVNFVANRL